MTKYETVIGLEIHAELKTKTKMFCASKNDPDEKHPNINICPVCTGQPGTLPVINKEAVNHVVKVGLALNSEISEVTKWDRKNYFYPDLPKGYQISQYDEPICLGGELEIPIFGKKIRITRVHLEEDTGRLLHFGHIGHSLVDFNRAGVPLMELVTEPDFHSGEEASAFAQELQLILRYLNVSSADMEKGQMRVEANVSLKLAGSEKLGTKVEIKNLNSFKTVRDAVNYEIKRQSKILDEDKKVAQETRGWSEDKGETISQRAKEGSHDYRYFPEPDLPPFKITQTEIEEITSKIPELPSQRRNRFKKQYGLPDNDIEIFTDNKSFGDYYEHVASELDLAAKDFHSKQGLQGEYTNEPHVAGKLHSIAANYIITEFSAFTNIEISPEACAELMVLIFQNQLSSTAAKAVLKEMAKTGLHPEHIIKEKDLIQIQDEGELQKSAQKVIGENQKAVADYKNGKEASLQFLVGQVMKETRGKANPEIIADILKNLLK